MRGYFKGWRRKAGVAILIVGAVLSAFGMAQWHQAASYPFGWSHCCDKGLYLALRNYSDVHGGAFPAGEATPEASLSLLYRQDLADANLLRGKSVPESTVQEILDRGELLGPESCGWHYVEGLHQNDDGRIAIFWDKEGLDHNGRKLSGGGHIVWFLNSDHPHITDNEWAKFLAEQELLHKARLTIEPNPN